MIEHRGGATSPALITRGRVLDIWRTAPRRRLAAPVVNERAVWDRVPRALRDALLQAADDDRRHPWPELLVEHWAAYRSRGTRLAYEDPFFARSERTTRAVVAAALEPTEDRITEAANGLWLLCEQSSWCWPAHDESFARGLATTDVSRPVLDLGAGEAAALVAWADLTLGPLLDAAYPGLRDRLRAEVARRTLEPLLAEQWHWEGTEEHMHNWAPWIYGNLLVAAHAFADGDRFERVAERCIDGIDRYLAQVPGDGAIDEGVGYWWQGAARAFEALTIIDGATGGAVSHRAAPGGSLAGLSELARFVERAHLGGDWYVSYSDAEARMNEPMPWQVLFRAARLCGAESAERFAVSRARDVAVVTRGASSQAGLGRILATVTDDEWLAASDGRAALPGRVDLDSIGIGIARERAGSPDGLTLVAKAGNNDEAHNHNDLGTVEIAVDGVPVIVDLGRETYTAETFSDARSSLWYVSSPWHSTPLPRGLAQEPGATSRASMTATARGWAIDLGQAYPFDAGETWMRTAELDDGSVRVRDEWRLTEGTGSVVLVCAGEPRETADGICVPSATGGRGVLLAHDAADVRIEQRAVDDPIMARSWGDAVARIVLTAGADATSLTVEAVAE